MWFGFFVIYFHGFFSKNNIHVKMYHFFLNNEIDNNELTEFFFSNFSIQK